MLFLVRRQGESIIINDDIVITIEGIKRNNVKLRIDHPKESRVLRKEIYDKIQQENLMASSQVKDIIEALQLNGKKITPQPKESQNPEEDSSNKDSSSIDK